MFGGVVVTGIFLGIIVVGLGCLGGGIYMCWASATMHVCSDWSDTSEYAAHKCDYTYKDAGAMMYCNQLFAGTNKTAICVCYDPLTKQPECIQVQGQGRWLFGA